MGYIPHHALKNLQNYKYHGVDRSLLSNYVLTPYWNWLVTLWPTWVAPNMITLTGLSLVLINFATLLYYDPTHVAEKGGAGPPHWAAGLFMYQSLDAIDGKQARRTGMAGPLGEMFDHGHLYLGHFSGPVEGILLIVLIYILTGIYGPSFWDQKILTVTRLEDVEAIASRIPNIPLNVAFMIFGACGVALNIITSYINVYTSHRASGQALFKPLLYLLPFPASAIAQVLWMNHPKFSNSDILHSQVFVPFLCAWGLLFAHQVGRIILAHVASQPFPWWDNMFIWSVLGAIDANLPFLIGRPPLIQNSPENTAKFVYLTLVVTFLSYAHFVVAVINDITNYLGIACLTVRKRDARGIWRRAGPSSEKKI
ncbi:hypothetical protein EWM64_g2549 [Hericium alpestre]|uniref:Uncharacterized protein n=1 Tax=Hericium alpestre TaxID=135208 RepID=A0A4Z0A742_9AGAM|nr:hypothetical protein EWM64_g2549 [Hericium alpestre]